MAEHYIIYTIFFWEKNKLDKQKLTNIFTQPSTFHHVNTLLALANLSDVSSYSLFLYN